MDHSFELFSGRIYIRYSHAKASAARALHFFSSKQFFSTLPTCSGYRKSQKNLN